MRIIIILLLLSSSFILRGQQSNNVLCIDFTFDDKLSETGEKLTRIFKSELSNMTFPPTLVTREDFPIIYQKIQEQINLNKDLGIEQINKIKTSQIDYLVVGDFAQELASDLYLFSAKFIKISGDNVSSAIILPTLRFTKKEITQSSFFEQKIRNTLATYGFKSDYGLMSVNQLNEINKNLQNKDDKILGLQKQLQEQKRKDDSIQTLKKTVPNINFSLEIIDSYIVVVLNFQNLVPIKIKPHVETLTVENGTIKDLFFFGQMNSIYINYEEFYPTESKHRFEFKYQRLHPIAYPDTLVCRFSVDFESVYAAEINAPNPQKEAKADYMLLQKPLRLVKINVNDK